MKYTTSILLVFLSMQIFACDSDIQCERLKELGIEIRVTDLNEKSFYQCSMINITAPEYQRDQSLNNFQIHMRIKNAKDHKRYLTSFIATSFDSKTKKHNAAVCISPNIKQDVSLEFLYTNSDEDDKNPISVIADGIQKYVQSHNKAINNTH